MPISVHMWGGQKTSWGDQFFPSSTLGPGDQTRVIGFDSKHLYPLNHLTWADSTFFCLSAKGFSCNSVPSLYPFDPTQAKLVRTDVYSLSCLQKTSLPHPGSTTL